MFHFYGCDCSYKVTIAGTKRLEGWQTGWGTSIPTESLAIVTKHERQEENKEGITTKLESRIQHSTPVQACTACLCMQPRKTHPPMRYSWESNRTDKMQRDKKEKRKEKSKWKEKNIWPYKPQSLKCQTMPMQSWGHHGLPNALCAWMYWMLMSSVAPHSILILFFAFPSSFFRYWLGFPRSLKIVAGEAVRCFSIIRSAVSRVKACKIQGRRLCSNYKGNEV